MAWFKTGGGGGALSETVLWTNPSPTSNFATQTVTLSQSIENFDYIKFVHRISTSASNSGETIYSVSTFKTSSNSVAIQPVIAARTGGNGYPVRRIRYVSDTTVSFLSTNNAGSGASYNDAYCIPLSIIGIKL